MSGMPYAALGILYYTYYSLSHRCSYPMYLIEFLWNMYPYFFFFLTAYFKFHPSDVFLNSLYTWYMFSYIRLHAFIVSCIWFPYRRSMRVMRTGATCSESTVPRYVNTWSTSSTSLNTCRRSTWWTAYWRTLPSYRYPQESVIYSTCVCGGWGFQCISLFACMLLSWYYIRY